MNEIKNCQYRKSTYVGLKVYFTSNNEKYFQQSQNNRIFETPFYSRKNNEHEKRNVELSLERYVLEKFKFIIFFFKFFLLYFALLREHYIIYIFHARSFSLYSIYIMYTSTHNIYIISKHYNISFPIIPLCIFLIKLYFFLRFVKKYFYIIYSNFCHSFVYRIQNE